MGLSDALDSGYQDPNAVPPPDFSSPPAKDLASQYVSTPDQTTSTPAALNYSPAGGGYTPATEPTPPAPTVPQGMGAYGAGASAPPQAGGLSPEMQARIANYRAPYRPGGYTPTTETVKSSPVDPAQAASLGELEQAKLEQAQAQQNWQQAAAKAQAPLLDQQAKERAAFQANVKSSLDQHVQKIQTLTDNASKAANEAPESFWGDNPGTRILRTVGMAAMAFGHGLNGNAADPMQFMNSMIAQNVAKQKAKVDAAKGDLDREQNLYAMMKQKFGDDESALTATQMLQKQAVLDKLDESFQAPTAAKVTWGKAPEEDPEVTAIRNMPPTARLNLANMRLGLAQSIYEDRAKLFDKHASSIEASQAYHAASGGGSADPLEQLKRVAAGEQAAATINTAGRKAAADVAKEEASTQAEISKAAAATGATGERKSAFEQMAAEVGSTNVFEHPIDWLTAKLGIQGTEGQKKRLLQEAYNSGAVADVLETHKGLAKNKEMFQEAVHAYLLDPNATSETINLQKSLRRQNLVNRGGQGPSAVGVTPGEAEDVGD